MAFLQGAASFFITLVLATAVAAMSMRLHRYASQVWLPPILTVVCTTTMLVTIHCLAGTAHVLATIVPPSTVAFGYCLHLSHRLARRPFKEMCRSSGAVDAHPNMEIDRSLINRRPIRVRSSKLAAAAAQWLTANNVTPNQISVMSVVFAMAAGMALVARAQFSGLTESIWLMLAALFVQCRLLCNLLDGMVAVEGGKSTPAGELFNDMPDRIADAVILVAAGYSVPTIPAAVVLGWMAAVLAVLTAYIRVLGVSLGAHPDFRGPMAKQHRMAVLTLACVLSLLEPFSSLKGECIAAALMVIVVGCCVTSYRRTLAMYRFLSQRT
ncbi:CDP-alcohol phosphatidyltransferase family protein [Aquabacterium sp.]|uniref:CDP-alcohol phosphatidyltransferase family protein n=1 Tax=Aquabacterium sp. TaxID=1872578 RepID=UPI0025C2400C|nr:CDP-alcohol phosphatidyltransferase family protein [Aquabacterium sp.]